MRQFFYILYIHFCCVSKKARFCEICSAFSCFVKLCNFYISIQFNLHIKLCLWNYLSGNIRTSKTVDVSGSTWERGQISADKQLFTFVVSMRTLQLWGTIVNSPNIFGLCVYTTLCRLSFCPRATVCTVHIVYNSILNTNRIEWPKCSNPI